MPHPELFDLSQGDRARQVLSLLLFRIHGRRFRGRYGQNGGRPDDPKMVEGNRPLPNRPFRCAAPERSGPGWKRSFTRTEEPGDEIGDGLARYRRRCPLSWRNRRARALGLVPPQKICRGVGLFSGRGNVALAGDRPGPFLDQHLDHPSRQPRPGRLCQRFGLRELRVDGGFPPHRPVVFLRPLLYPLAGGHAARFPGKTLQPRPAATGWPCSRSFRRSSSTSDFRSTPGRSS